MALRPSRLLSPCVSWLGLVFSVNFHRAINDVVICCCKILHYSLHFLHTSFDLYSFFFFAFLPFSWHNEQYTLPRILRYRHSLDFLLISLQNEHCSTLYFYFIKTLIAFYTFIYTCPFRDSSRHLKRVSNKIDIDFFGVLPFYTPYIDNNHLSLKWFFSCWFLFYSCISFFFVKLNTFLSN